MKVFKFLGHILPIIFIMCNSHDKKMLIYGKECKIWILYDESIISSFYPGYTPFVFCFNKNSYKTYSILGNGSLRKRIVGHFSNDLLDGGKWYISDDSLRINGVSTHVSNIVEDTIILPSSKMLINITNKFNLKNCNSSNFEASFKGGKVDSISWILKYAE